MFAEQFSTVAKSSFESHVAAASALNTQALEGFAQLLDLNLKAARAGLEESTAAAQQFLSAKDPGEFFKLISAQGQPAAAKAVEWSRNLAGIASATQSSLAKTAQAQAAVRTAEAQALVEQLLKSAPAGSEQGVTLIRSAIANANASYQQINQLTEQAQQSVGQNLGKVFAQFAVPVATAEAATPGRRARK
ncbi:MAG: hypothetical protein JWP36_2178 [Paucimonas sp.]|nr:hypothetical protein [Paucimonas sp.]